MRSSGEKTTKGQELKFFSSEHNSFIDAADDLKQRQDNFNVPGKIANTKPGIVDVQNISGETVDQYHYMVVEKFIFKPEDNESGFKNEVSFKVNIFDEDNEDHVGAALVVLLQPIKDEAVGLAMIVGSSQIRVNIKDEAHTYAILKSGETILESSFGGPVSMVTKEEGEGEKWAYGCFPNKSLTQQYKVKGLNKPDSITCVTWDGTDEGELEIEVAMDWIMRKTPFDEATGEPRKDISFVYDPDDFHKRTATITVDGEDEEQEQVILPSFEENDIIYASEGIIGGVGVVDKDTDKPLIWLDDNRSGREWSENTEDEEEESAE